MSKLGKISFIFAIISLLSMFATYYTIKVWVPFCWVCLTLVIFFVGLAFYKDRLFFKDLFSMKTTKEGMSMGSMVLVLLGTLIAVNYFGGKYSKTWDFSLSKINTLSAQSISVVKEMKSDLKFFFFYKRGVEGNEENRNLFKELVKKYQDHNSHISLEFVEVNEKPDLAAKFGVDKGSGVAFVEYEGRTNRIEKIDEQDFTSALVKVFRTNSKVIYFVLGHGEESLGEEKDGLGLASLKNLLQSNRYEVKELPLTTVTTIPADADVVFIVGPKQQFQDFEITALELYLHKGGSLFIAQEPKMKTGLDSILNKVGLRFQNNYILNQVDTVMGKGINQGPTLGVIFSMNNKITKPFGRAEATVFRYPQSIKKVESVKDVVVDELVSTDPNAMSFDTLQIAGEGPVDTWTVVSEVSGIFPGSTTNKKFSMIVAGDVDFLTNQMLYQNLNRDLVLNSIAALAKEDSLISVTPKEASATKMILTNTRFSVFLFGFIIPLPLILGSIALGLWIKRKNA